jgi:putative chitinase
MMELREALTKAGVSEANITRYCQHLEEQMPRYSIVKPLTKRHFLAQILHESAGLRVVRENLNYTADGLLKTFPRYFPNWTVASNYQRQPERIANRVYANRMNNGDEDSGDGWRFSGRGLIQTTGRLNYTVTSSGLFGDDRLLTNPEILEEPRYAVESACFFWKKNGLNELAETNDIEAITRRVNGGLNGLDDRKKYFTLLAGMEE